MEQEEVSYVKIFSFNYNNAQVSHNLEANKPYLFNILSIIN